MRQINVRILLVIVAFVVSLPSLGLATDVGGIIDTDTTWTLANSPYTLIDCIQIAEGITLTIEPGVVVNGEGHSIQVWGTLQAIGTDTSNIVFNNVGVHAAAGGTNPLINIQFAKCNSFTNWGHPTVAGARGTFILRDSRVQNIGEIYPLSDSHIERNTFIKTDPYPYGIQIYLDDPRSDCYIEKNIFIDAGGILTYLTYNVKIYIRNNVFYQQKPLPPVSYPCYAVSNWGSLGTSETIVEYNSFLSTDKIAVVLAPERDVRMIAINNYWNTTDTDVIDAMIYDRNDDLNVVNYIEYLPILYEPHPDTPIFCFPEMKVNNSDGPITLYQNDTLTITVSLNNNGITENADWWLAAVTPLFDVFFYIRDQGWTDAWMPGFQGPLFYLDSFEVLNMPVSGLPAGTYTLYFGVDTVMDGNVTWDSVYYDTVEVNITE